MKKRMVLVISACLLSLACVLAGCEVSMGSGSHTLQDGDLITDGTLKVAVVDNFKPMEYRNASNELVGFDVDFAKEIADSLGLKVEFVPATWTEIFNGLDAKKYDVIISAASLTSERQASYDCTQTYIANGVVIVSRSKDQPVTKFEELNGKVVALEKDSTSDKAVQAAVEKYGTNVIIQEKVSVQDAFQDLYDGKVDNVVTDALVAKSAVDDRPNEISITSSKLTDENYTIYLRKGNKNLKAVLNDTIDKLRENGTLSDASTQWFGDDSTVDVGNTYSINIDLGN